MCNVSDFGVDLKFGMWISTDSFYTPAGSSRQRQTDRQTDRQTERERLITVTLHLQGEAELFSFHMKEEFKSPQL